MEEELETLGRFIVEGTIEHAVKLSSCIGRSGNHHLSRIQHDEVGTALISRDTFTGQSNIVLKTTGHDNCMFNAASIWLVGNESLGDVIQLLFAGELFSFPDYFVQITKERFLEVENSISYSEATVFLTILTEVGEKE